MYHENGDWRAQFEFYHSSTSRYPAPTIFYFTEADADRYLLTGRSQPQSKLTNMVTTFTEGLSDLTALDQVAAAVVARQDTESTVSETATS